MIQIGVNPPSAALGEATLSAPQQVVGIPSRQGIPEADDLSAQPREEEGCPFVSPLPMPFPRVFPGL